MDLATLRAAMELTAAAVKPEPVTLPGWGTLYIKALTVAEVDENLQADADEKDQSTRLARGAARVIVDETGARIFDPDNAEHVALLGRQPWVMLQKLIRRANVINAQGDDGEAEAGNV